MPFRQCELKRTVNGSPESTVAFIDSKLAIVDRNIEVKTSSGQWEPWKVALVSGDELSDAHADKMFKRYHILETQDLSLKHRNK